MVTLRILTATSSVPAWRSTGLTVVFVSMNGIFFSTFRSLLSRLLSLSPSLSPPSFSYACSIVFSRSAPKNEKKKQKENKNRKTQKKGDIYKKKAYVQLEIKLFCCCCC
jgi:hypothetical protein